jgi:DeoR/GlpR family transcriptional regulator of sugar metabolism
MADTKHDPSRRRDGATLGAARQQRILAMVTRGEIIAVGELAQRFSVSQETIRRDIRALEEAGGLRRVHGGAAPTGAAPMGAVDLTARRPVAERLDVDRAAKTSAAEAALPLFEDGMNVFLGGSSTMLLLAEALARHGPALSVTTNMIDIATALAASGRCKVTLLGGSVNVATRTLIGPHMLEALDRQVFDLAACGASAIDPVHGALGPSEWHAAIGANLARRARRLAFVVDAGKFGRGDAHVVQPLACIDALATDRRPPPEIDEAIAAAGITLLLPIANDGAR